MTASFRAGPELAFPLPESDPSQVVESTLWLAPGGQCATEGAGAARHLSAPAGAQIELRVRVALQPAPQAASERPALAQLRERLAGTSDPAAVVAAAVAAGHSARVGHGLRWGAGAPELARWAELEVEGAWLRWSAADYGGEGVQTLRLGSTPPRGVQDLELRAERHAGAGAAPTAAEPAPAASQAAH